MSLSSPQKYITIATDISSDPVYKISTWACYIRCDEGIIKHSGVFRENPVNTIYAETFALINALTIASRISYWPESRVIIHNEIERVLTPLKNKSGNLAVREIDRTEAVMTIAMPLLDMAGSWELRKIKAHKTSWRKSDNPAKYAMNRWCDKEARRLLKETRNRTKKL